MHRYLPYAHRCRRPVRRCPVAGDYRIVADIVVLSECLAALSPFLIVSVEWFQVSW